MYSEKKLAQCGDTDMYTSIMWLITRRAYITNVIMFVNLNYHDLSDNVSVFDIEINRRWENYLV